MYHHHHHHIQFRNGTDLIFFLFCSIYSFRFGFNAKIPLLIRLAVSVLMLMDAWRLLEGGPRNQKKKLRSFSTHPLGLNTMTCIFSPTNGKLSFFFCFTNHTRAHTHSKLFPFGINIRKVAQHLVLEFFFFWHLPYVGVLLK